MARISVPELPILATSGLAFIAGTLSILSPCILPLLPLLFLGARATHRFGIMFLSAGLALTFTAISLFVATLGFSRGLDGQLFQSISASLMIALGIVLVMPRLQSRFAMLFNPIANTIANKAHGLPATGPIGQFGLGILLGGAFTPCAGPTLGAAAAMAARGRNLPEAGLVMLSFGIGAAVPLLLLGRMSRVTFVRWQSRLATTGRHGRTVLGTVFLAFGVMIVTGLNQTLETFLVSHQPMWLLALTTRY
ncbi:MAG: cytochrome c biogenesis CcdA family protein [Rhizomicrobium sp.]